MFRIVSLIIGYSFGILQASWFVGRLSGRKRIAAVFSLNVLKAMAAFAFATVVYNALFIRSFNPFPFREGLIDELGLLDGLPLLAELGILERSTSPIFAFTRYAGGTFFRSGYVMPGMWAGVGAVLGHCFPFGLKEKGGKGVACVLATIFMADWRVALFVLAVGAIAVLVTRCLSAGALAATLLAPIFLFLERLVFFLQSDFHSFHMSVRDEVFWILRYMSEFHLTVVMCVFVWVMLRGNIKRLYKGEEETFY